MDKTKRDLLLCLYDYENSDELIFSYFNDEYIKRKVGTEQETDIVWELRQMESSGLVLCKFDGNRIQDVFLTRKGNCVAMVHRKSSAIKDFILWNIFDGEVRWDIFWWSMIGVFIANVLISLIGGLQ